MKIKFIVFSVMILMYQNNVVYSSSSDESDSSYSYESESTTCDEQDIEKREYYFDTLEEFKDAIQENNFTYKEYTKLLGVIKYVKNLCIEWDKTDNDIENTNKAITEVILKKIQDRIKLRSEIQYERVTNLINICNDLKHDIEKREDCFDKLEEFKDAIQENDFTYKEYIKLLEVIEYIEKLCINWDKTSSEMEYINNVINFTTKIILKMRDNIILRSKKQYEIVTDLINVCNELKQDLSKVLINQDDSVSNIIV